MKKYSIYLKAWETCKLGAALTWSRRKIYNRDAVLAGGIFDAAQLILARDALSKSRCGVASAGSVWIQC